MAARESQFVLHRPGREPEAYTNTPRHVFTCEGCGKEGLAAMPTRKYCGEACRRLARHKRQGRARSVEGWHFNCVDCNAECVGGHPRKNRCDECRRAKTAAYMRDYQRERRQRDQIAS